MDGGVRGTKLQVIDQPIVNAIWKDKYRYGDEATIQDTFSRVAVGVCKNDIGFVDTVYAELASRRMSPGGRIFAGAGTEKIVTMINCFVSPDILDSLVRPHEGRDAIPIMDALKVAAGTQQMGGGIGMDFSTLRPEGAVVKSTGSVATGPLYFMDMWNWMCASVKSSGARRGAMMGTMSVWHPDIRSFIRAKRTKDRLTNFNVSVLVTDAFMNAVKKDEGWELIFHQPRADGKHVRTYRGVLPGFGTMKGYEELRDIYVYETVRARDLWDEITKLTYVYAEPGIIFIDRINEWNNLNYCEHIHCTNPCGEQPLPANGDCNLGHVNLAACVDDAFGQDPAINLNEVSRTTKHLVRFLDNVLDVSLFTTPEQKAEAQAKRRTGIGFTALGTTMQMLKLRYGSPEAIALTSTITKEMAASAYMASAQLAKERGPFPLYDREKFLKQPFVQKLPEEVQEAIAEHGIRNGVLLTVAPTGTTSLLAGNVSSGIEPVFALKAKRQVREPDGTFTTYDPVWDFGYLAWCRHIGVDPEEQLEQGKLGPIPKYINCTIDDLTVEQHIGMQAAAQEWVDASISKTITVPTEFSFDQFKQVYSVAYDLGLKGCTTYRFDPEAGRGAVLAKSDDKPKAQEIKPVDKIPMQRRLEGVRYQVKWPGFDHAFYIQINDYVDEAGQRRPFELFITTKSAQHDEWLRAISRLATGIFRRGGDVTFIVEELQQVTSARGGAYYDKEGRISLVPSKKFVGSLIAAIGDVIQEHFQWLGLLESAPSIGARPSGVTEAPKAITQDDTCPRCNAPALKHAEGCSTCTNCGYSNCA